MWGWEIGVQLILNSRHDYNTSGRHILYCEFPFYLFFFLSRVCIFLYLHIFDYRQLKTKFKKKKKSITHSFYKNFVQTNNCGSYFSYSLNQFVYFPSKYTIYNNIIYSYVTRGRANVFHVEITYLFRSQSPAYFRNSIQTAKTGEFRVLEIISSIFPPL